MGAWGFGPFANDDAADWAAQFDGVDQSAGIGLLNAAVDAVQQSDYVEAPEGAVAIAAAQVVGWLRFPSRVEDSSSSEPVVTWVRAYASGPSEGLVLAARRAVQRVRSDDSELAELWADAESADWILSLDGVDSLLRTAT